LNLGDIEKPELQSQVITNVCAIAGRGRVRHLAQPSVSIGADGVMRGRILLLIPSSISLDQIDRTFFAPPEGWELTLQTIPLSR
jgi:hypothetical protein